jgi:chemotaxis protein methyltransferase CheR
LPPFITRFGFGSLGGLATAIVGRPAETLAETVVEALTTPETSFFRDGYPFDLLRRVMLPDLLHLRAADRQLRVWSAAWATSPMAAPTSCSASC